jgi:uncharacterized spore protein YtfJ
MAMVNKIMDAWKDTYSVRRVFGDPVEKDGVTVIPVATVTGGGGGGSGSVAEADDPSEGEGGGFAGTARPAGVYVVRADGVEWQPAIDVTLLGVAGIALAAFIAMVVGSILRRRR